ncbi:MAG: hypothetical protein Ta2A_04160 [Treponemataceae bacterium]|nr:MAG: hypothetical protein Ta2A_04160 [Treponemataceae bacterium]
MLKKKLFYGVLVIILCVGCKPKNDSTATEDGDNELREVSRASAFAISEEIIKEFPRLPDEPENMDPKKFYDEDWMLGVGERIDVFTATLSPVFPQEQQELLLAHWVFENNAGKKIDGINNYMGTEFDTYIRSDTGELRYICGTNYGTFYFSATGTIYLQRTCMFAVEIKQIKFYDDKLYVYTLDFDKWVLDPVHKGGKYFYAKYPAREYNPIW